MPNFMIDAGDSTTGPVGFVLRLNASDRVQALKRAKALLWALAPDQAIPVPVPDELRGEVEYLRVYLNPDALTLNDMPGGEVAGDDGEDPRDGDVDEGPGA